MVTILQYVTTYPIELMECPKLSITEIESVTNVIPSQIDYTPETNIKKFYSITISDKNTKRWDNENILEVTVLLTHDGPININTLGHLNALDKQDINKKTKEKIKTNYINYNIIYNKLFEHNLNYIEQYSKNKTIIIFLTHDKSDNGKFDLNKKFYSFYIDKFDKIQSNINFNNNICYLDLKVFSSKDKEEYKKLIIFEFNRIKGLIKNYNENIKQQIKIGKGKENDEIKNIVFILDLDKKNLFTGLYNKELSKEKKEILSKEYSSFLSTQGFISKSVEDSNINITYRDFISQANVFKGFSGMTLSLNNISKKLFEEFILLLKNNYRLIVDKQFKKSLEEKDNIKKLSIFYRLKNVDKELDDTILTGSNKIYTLTYKNNGPIMKDLKGYFILISKQRGIYNFIEDTQYYRERTKGKGMSKIQNETKEEEHSNNTNNKNINNEPSNDTDRQNKNVKITFKYGKILYESIKDQNEIGKKGEIIDLYDKVSIERFKWFRPKDLDLSLSEENKIKYYDDILFDKNTLIEYIKFKKRYSDKTNLSYEFLKINDSSELIEYCDFIHENFKNNIKENKFNLFNSFNEETIKNNIIDIIFQPNNIIYIQALTKTTEEQRDSSTKDNYKIVDKEIFNKYDFEKEDTTICHKLKNGNFNTDCSQNYEEYLSKYKTVSSKIVIVTITKINIKDISLLKKKVKCKTKKTNIKYKYKKLFKRFTQKFGNYMIDPYKGGKLTTSKKSKVKKVKLKN